MSHHHACPRHIPAGPAAHGGDDRGRAGQVAGGAQRSGPGSQAGTARGEGAHGKGGGTPGQTDRTLKRKSSLKTVSCARSAVRAAPSRAVLRTQGMYAYQLAKRESATPRRLVNATYFASADTRQGLLAALPRSPVLPADPFSRCWVRPPCPPGIPLGPGDRAEGCNRPRFCRPDARARAEEHLRAVGLQLARKLRGAAPAAPGAQ